MAKIKIAEQFYSLQGEGLYAGVPSVFLRTFGCNFQCRGFGMSEGGLSKEPERIANSIDLGEADYNTLPLAKTGCDSYGSWHPKFKHLSKMMTTEDIVSESVDIVDQGRSFNHPNSRFKNIHYVITGGEPLLGWQRSYPKLFDQLHITGFRNVTFETNGTQEITADFKDYLLNSRLLDNRMNLTFSVSAKLSESGETHIDAIKPEIVTSYQQLGNVYLKFVVSDNCNLNEIYKVINEYREYGFNGEVYLMPEGGTPDNYYANTRKVAELCMMEGYRYSPRLQVDLWGNANAT